MNLSKRTSSCRPISSDARRVRRGAATGGLRRTPRRRRRLPDMPIFLKPDFYVPAPLEETYWTTWNDFFPAPMKRLLETPSSRRTRGMTGIGLP